MAEMPVLLKVVEHAVFNVPSSMHDQPNRLRFHEGPWHRRCDVVFDGFIRHPLGILTGPTSLLHFETSDRLIKSMPHHTAFCVPDFHVISSGGEGGVGSSLVSRGACSVVDLNGRLLPRKLGLGFPDEHHVLLLYLDHDVLVALPQCVD